MMDYFEIAKGITNDYTRQLMKDKRITDLEKIVELQTKLIKEQQDMIVFLKVYVL